MVAAVSGGKFACLHCRPLVSKYYRVFPRGADAPRMPDAWFLTYIIHTRQVLNSYLVKDIIVVDDVPAATAAVQTSLPWSYIKFYNMHSSVVRVRP